jgi:ribosomal protein S18 acetylase RimI-like enzyme
MEHVEQRIDDSKIKPLELRRDIDGIGDLIQVSFDDDLTRSGQNLHEEIRSTKRVIPLVIALGWVSDYFRHIIEGFVWEDRGRIVGSVLMQRGNDKTRWHISTIATHPDYRRQGIARQLTMRAMEHAREHGAEVCVLDVRSDNAPAYELYRSLGFVHFDSSIALKLEELPSVQVQRTDDYVLRPIGYGDWQVRYDLAVRDTPPEVHAFLPVSAAHHRVTTGQQLIVPVLQWLQRRDVHWWIAEQDGQPMGYMYLAARCIKNIHELQLTIDPAHHTALTELLLCLALETLQEYPRQNVLISTRTAYTNLLSVLKRYGFVELETMHQLGAKLDHFGDQRSSRG